MKQDSDMVPVAIDEKSLWLKFQQGDEDALAQIYSTFFDPLYNYGFKFTRDSTLIEDCIQELFLKLMRNRKNYTVPDSIRNYLFKAFRSQMFDRMEQLKKQVSRDINDSMTFELESEKGFQDLDEEKQKKLQVAMAQLTPRQREAIFLKYHEGFSYPAIAEMLSLSQKATYKLIGRAIQTLRDFTVSVILVSGLCLF